MSLANKIREVVTERYSLKIENYIKNNKIPLCCGCGGEVQIRVFMHAGYQDANEFICKGCEKIFGRINIDNIEDSLRYEKLCSRNRGNI